jgi:hypothetical protein
MRKASTSSKIRMEFVGFGDSGRARPKGPRRGLAKPRQVRRREGRYSLVVDPLAFLLQGLPGYGEPHSCHASADAVPGLAQPGIGLLFRVAARPDQLDHPSPEPPANM